MSSLLIDPISMAPRSSAVIDSGVRHTARGRVLDPSHLGDHLDRLYRAAWALCGSREEAEDLVQDTYAHVLARPRFLRDDDDLGYLLRALRNTFVSRYRTAARRPRKADVEVEHVAVADEDHSIDPVAAVEAREVYAVIAELPDEFRDVLVAIDVVGLSYAETAKALRLRPGTVTSRLSRARGRVAASLMRAAGDDE
jgi:RNA polymerase sigma-70 factor (ECF subfamily)